MDQPLVDQVRSFNRVVTRRIGALDDHYLGRSRPLGQDRVLWEIGADGCEIRAMRARLGLDAGHTSRLLRALEAANLILITPSDADRRVRIARLTNAGQTERALLEQRSDELATSILAPLTDAQRTELTAAMRTVRRLLLTSEIEIRPTNPVDQDAQRCIDAYFAELNHRSSVPYDPSQGPPAEPHEMTPPKGLFLVVYLRDEAVGCGGVKHHPDGPSEIKRMWVAQDARGLGIARRILSELESDARRAGAPASRLETNQALTEAIAMYRSAGYEEVPAFSDEPFAHHWFEKAL